MTDAERLEGLGNRLEAAGRKITNRLLQAQQAATSCDECGGAGWVYARPAPDGTEIPCPECLGLGTQEPAEPEIKHPRTIDALGKAIGDALTLERWGHPDLSREVEERAVALGHWLAERHRFRSDVGGLLDDVALVSCGIIHAVVDATGVDDSRDRLLAVLGDALAGVFAATKAAPGDHNQRLLKRAGTSAPTEEQKVRALSAGWENYMALMSKFGVPIDREEGR